MNACPMIVCQKSLLACPLPVMRAATIAFTISCIWLMLVAVSARDIHGNPDAHGEGFAEHWPPSWHATGSIHQSSSSSIHQSSSSSRVLLQVGLPQCPSQCAAGACKEVGASGTYFCHQCTNSYIVDYSSGDCVCAPGRYVDGGRCVRCPVGEYCPGSIAATGNQDKIQCQTGLTTLRRGASSANDCVNAAGYFYVNSTQATPCPADTYTAGRAYQRSCTPCSAGFHTAGVTGSSGPSACTLKAGYFLASPGQPALCPPGSYNAGTNMVATCTKCPTGVTTQNAGAMSSAACILLLPGYEAVSEKVVSPTKEIQQAQPCRQDAYCPGTTAALATGLGFTDCPNGRWTRNISSIHIDQCLVPPGHYWPTGNAVTKCPAGTYKSGWTNAQTTMEAACIACGANIFTEDTLTIPRYNSDGSSATGVDVADSPMSCYIKPGMGMLRAIGTTSGTWTWVGIVCNTTQSCGVKASGTYLYKPTCSTYGNTTNIYGLAITPCRTCVGTVGDQDTASGGYTTCTPTNCTNGLIPARAGSTGCEVPAGRAAAKEDGTTVIYEFNAEVTAADVKASVPCPPNHYCLAGNPEAASGANGLPQRCPDNKISPEGSDDVTDCVLDEPNR